MKGCIVIMQNGARWLVEEAIDANAAMDAIYHGTLTGSVELQFSDLQPNKTEFVKARVCRVDQAGNKIKAS